MAGLSGMNNLGESDGGYKYFEDSTIRYPSGDVNGKLGIYFGVWDRRLIWESYM